MLRKILMVCIAVWLSHAIQVQALCATLLVVVALCVHSLACPYVTDAMDGLELLSLFGSFCTYFFGQFLFTPSVGDGAKLVVSFIIVLVNLAVVTAVALMIAGKGLGAVAAFGRKFRKIICCAKSPDAKEKYPRENREEGDDDDVGNNKDTIRTPKRQKTRQFEPAHVIQQHQVPQLEQSPVQQHLYQHQFNPAHSQQPRMGQQTHIIHQQQQPQQVLYPYPQHAMVPIASSAEVSPMKPVHLKSQQSSLLGSPARPQSLSSPPVHPYHLKHAQRPQPNPPQQFLSVSSLASPGQRPQIVAVPSDEPGYHQST